MKTYIFISTIVGILFLFVFTLSNRILAQENKWIIYDTVNSELPANWINSIVVDNDGNVWIGAGSFGGGGIAKIVPPSSKNTHGHASRVIPKWTVFYASNSGLPENYVRSVAIDKKGNLWAGTEYSGIAMFDGSNWTVYNTSNSDLPVNYVKSIFADEKGNTWIGTFGGGIVKLTPSGSEELPKWTNYNTSNSGIAGDIIGAINIDQKGTVWVGTYEGGLAGFDPEKSKQPWVVLNTSNSKLPNNRIKSIAFDKKGNIWLGTNGGLVTFAPGESKSWKVYDQSNSGLPDNKVWAVAIDQDDNIWIGTDKGGIAKLVPSVSEGPPRKETEISKEATWTIYNKKSKTGLAVNTIVAIAIDSRGYKWVGTYGGGVAVFK